MLEKSKRGLMMALKISVINQKGGGGRSTIARALTAAFTKGGWDTLLADMDTQQQTSFEWAGRRESQKDVKQIEAASFRTQASADKAGESRDLIVYDGKPHADELSVSLALQSDMVVIATGAGLDDLNPSLRFAELLTKKGISRNRIIFIINRATSPTEGAAGIDTVEAWGFKVVSIAIAAKATYVKALDSGRCITEVSIQTLREQAREAIQELINAFTEITQ